METILQKKLSIDKTKWTAVKFGEVVFEPKESSKDPVADGIKHVVGLEHIESENIHLRKSETLEESTTFTKKFAIGDVLFGRRRAYLRKASQASFNGICSGDITVFRAKENLMPELLPFVVNNEKFFDYAIKHSAGGLSPRVKFKDLANYEFLLPPKDQQAQLAKLLWAMDEVIESEKEVLSKIKINDLSHLKHYFYDDKTSDRLKLKNIVSIKKGKQPSELLENESGVPYCKAKYLRSGVIEQSVPETSLIKSILINDDDIIILWDGAAGEIFKGRKGVLASTMSKIEIINNEFIKDYIFEFLRFRSSSINRASVGSVIKHVDPTYFNNILVPKFSLDKQNLIVNKFNSLRLNIEICKSKIKSSKSLQKSLINQVF